MFLRQVGIMWLGYGIMLGDGKGTLLSAKHVKSERLCDICCDHCLKLIAIELRNC